jgi:hypothetical protein
MQTSLKIRMTKMTTEPTRANLQQVQEAIKVLNQEFLNVEFILLDKESMLIVTSTNCAYEIERACKEDAEVTYCYLPKGTHLEAIDHNTLNLVKDA